MTRTMNAVLLRPLLLLFVLAGIGYGNTLQINEFMASNGSTVSDEDGDFEDWIELHNAGTETVDLEGWGLSDDPDDPFRWTFPSVSLDPGEYFLVWASGKDRKPDGDGNGGDDNGNGDDPDPGVSPDAIPGLVSWFKADAEAGLSDGDPVAVWEDHSGLGNDATALDPTDEPVFRSDVINGLPALDFNGSTHQFSLPHTSFEGIDNFENFTFFAFARWDGGTTSGIWGTGPSNANSGNIHLEITSSDGDMRLRVGAAENDLSVSGGVEPGAWNMIGASQHTDGDGALSRLIVNGTVLGSSFEDPGAVAIAEFGGVFLGNSHNTNRRFHGMIAEVILYDHALSEEQRQEVETYLHQKYLESSPQPVPSEPPAVFPHTNFRISASGEPLRLTRPDGSIADAVPAVALPRDISYGRDPGAPETWVYFYQPTPGEPNGTDGLPALLEPVSFSVPSGVYSEPCTLDFAHHDPEAVILYTTDGSEPRWEALDGSTYVYMNSYKDGPLLERSTHTHIYDGSLTIQDRSSEPNQISMISSTEDSNPSYFPQSPIKKGTVVRARPYRNGAHGEVRSATYFVSGSGAFDYSLPVVSLSVTEADFFSYTDGIYVAGVDYVTDSGGYILSYGNFNRRGFEAERDAHFHYFENGELMLDQHIGVRIQGNASRRRAFKTLRLYARGASEAENSITHPFFTETVPGALFPDNNDFDRLVLRGPNFYDTVFSRLFQPVYEGVGGRVQPVIQFINGEFWGLGFLRDRFDHDHLKHHYGLDPDNITIVGFRYRHEVEDVPRNLQDRVYHLSHGIPGDMDDHDAMRDFISTADMTDPAIYAEAESLLCLDSFIDHLILKIFAADDHYAPEYIFWRARTPENETFGDGRWRVFVKDFDSTLRTGLGNLIERLAEGTHPRAMGYEMFANLLTNNSFRDRFINRYADLLNTHFRTERFDQIIHDSFNEVAPYWNEVSERWAGERLSNPDHPFTTDKRDTLLAYSEEQPARQRLHIRQYFDIPAQHNLTLNNSHPGRGTVRLNRITLDAEAETLPWSGIYFQGVPVPLEAQAEPGFRFVRWDITPGGGNPFSVETENFALSLTSATSVDAVFEPIPVNEQPVGMHVWDFEDAENLLTPAFTLGGGALQIDPGPETEVLPNTGGDFDTQHLRINNPLGAEVRFNLPGSGYEALHLEYLTRRSGQGAGVQTLAYTLDGESWIEFHSYEVMDQPPQAHSFDFSGIPEADDNADFAVRITFSQGLGGTAGNNRFDDVVLSGIALPETNLPPVVTGDPGLIALVEGSGAHEVDLEEVFSDPDEDPLGFQAHSSDESVAVVSVTGGTLDIEPVGRGGATVTVAADDGINPAVTHTFRVLVHPQAHALADESFEWGEWSAGEPAGSFPAHMLFLQGDEDDSSLTTALDYAYHIPLQDASMPEYADFPYAAEARTRINGLGPDGISFINTGRGRDLGGALVALDTRDVDSVPVAWLAGTVLANSREYALRLQYRVGIDSDWNDVLDEHEAPVEYIRSDSDGHVQPMEPVYLPEDALGEEYVQLLWRYYRVSGTTGPRAQLRLDDLYVGNSDLDRTAVELVFAEPPSGHIQSGNPLPPITVSAVGPEGFVDSDYAGEIEIFVHSGAATLSGTVAAVAVNGTAVFDDLSLQGLGAITLRAETTELGSVVSTPVQVAGITDELMPLFIQGDQDLQGNNNDRVPFAYRLSIEGLKPDSEYRFGNRVVLPEDPPEQDGAGNALIVTGADSDWVRNTDGPDFADEEHGARHWSFTTDASGAFSGWFVTEPTGNNRFTPGHVLRMRILLNDGADGRNTALMLTTSQHATVLPFGESSGQGSGIVGESDYSPRSFILLYDNTEGTGRPLAATPVESTGAETDERYAAFYNEVVSNTDGRWGSILPNDLPEGVRRIEHRAFDGSISNVRLRAEGYGGTINPTTGLAPVFIDITDSAYDDWRAEQFDSDEINDEDISGPLADPGGSGISNLMRYALGVGRADPYVDRLLRLAASPGGDLRLIHYQLLNPGPGLQYQLQFLTDLGPGLIWRNVEIGVDLVLESISPSGDGVTERHEYSIPGDLSSPGMFYRQRVILED